MEENTVMKILSVFDDAFSKYGCIHKGYDTELFMDVLEKQAPLPEGVMYSPSEPVLEECGMFGMLQNNAYGGMPIQIGWCVGHNTKLNCLEYHKCSEISIGSRDFILLLATLQDMENGMLDTGKVVAFHVPAGALVELYGPTLHYAPCCAKADTGFKVAVVLTKGTNMPRSDGDKPTISPVCDEDALLWRPNKWLLAHESTQEASAGACVRLVGENIDIASLL